MPIFQSSTFLYQGETDLSRCPLTYGSTTRRTTRCCTASSAALEGAEAALVTSSGMAAISTALLAVLRAGDHLLAIDCPYGGTRGFIVEELPRFGISGQLHRW